MPSKARQKSEPPVHFPTLSYLHLPFSIDWENFQTNCFRQAYTTGLTSGRQEIEHIDLRCLLTLKPEVVVVNLTCWLSKDWREGFHATLSTSVCCHRLLNFNERFCQKNSFNNGVFLKWIRNSVNSGNLINHWCMNRTQFKDPLFYLCPTGTVVAFWSLMQEVERPFLPSATKLRRLCFYTCLSFCSQGGGVCLSACWDATPLSRHPPWEQTPPTRSRHPSGSRHRPPRPADGFCCGRYASHWNAFLCCWFFGFQVGNPLMPILHNWL